MDKLSNDEIDLFSILEIIWNDKWKIFCATFFCMMICLTYILFTPGSYKATTIVQKSNQNLYYKYKYLNDILELRNDNPLNENQIFKIDNDRIVQMLINEFRDYNEMIATLSKNEYVKNKIKSLNDEKKSKLLVKLAKQFSIIPENKAEPLKISFRWHNIREGSLLFNNALNLTLVNVKNTILKQIENIAISIDFSNNREKETLNTNLKALRDMEKIKNSARIKYLTEQYNIAKELKIKDNQVNNFTNMNMSQITGYDSAPKIQTGSLDYPYYLRGFKAINKEIELIKKRSKGNDDMMMQGYLNIKQKLIIIDGDKRSKELMHAKEIINKEKVTEWINFNFESAEINNLKNPYIYISFSIIIGLVLGIVYVLINYSFRQRTSF